MARGWMGGIGQDGRAWGEAQEERACAIPPGSPAGAEALGPADDGHQ